MLKARTHLSNDEASLALREFREAARLRPRDEAVRSEIQRLNNMVNLPTDSQEHSVPSERIRSLFNLAVRYWDSNMPSAALKEVDSRFHDFLIFL